MSAGKPSPDRSPRESITPGLDHIDEFYLRIIFNIIQELLSLLIPLAFHPGVDTFLHIVRIDIASANMDDRIDILLVLVYNIVVIGIKSQATQNYA